MWGTGRVVRVHQAAPSCANPLSLSVVVVALSRDSAFIPPRMEKLRRAHGSVGRVIHGTHRIEYRHHIRRVPVQERLGEVHGTQPTALDATPALTDTEPSTHRQVQINNKDENSDEPNSNTFS